MKNETFESVDFDLFQKVTVEMNKGSLQGHYPTHVDHVERTRLTLRVPFHQRLYLPLEPKDVFTFHCTKLSGSYKCKIKVNERSEEGAYPVFTIPRPAKMKRIQHRKDVRVPCEIDVELWVLEPGTEKIKEGPLTVKAVDMSAGGMKIHSDNALEEGAEIVMNFDLPLIDKQLETVFGEVLRCFDEKVGDQFVSAVKFRGLPSFQEDNIIKYAFRRQIQLKKQGRWKKS